MSLAAVSGGKKAVLHEREAIQNPLLNGNEPEVGGAWSERRGHDNKSEGTIGVIRRAYHCLSLWLWHPKLQLWSHRLHSTLRSDTRSPLHNVYSLCPIVWPRARADTRRPFMLQACEEVLYRVQQTPGVKHAAWRRKGKEDTHMVIQQMKQQHLKVNAVIVLQYLMSSPCCDLWLETNCINLIFFFLLFLFTLYLINCTLWNWCNNHSTSFQTLSITK